MARIVVINPNSSASVTHGIDKAVQPLAKNQDFEIVCETLPEGPPAIESQDDCDSVVAPLAQRIESNVDNADAFVIACYSDPGIDRARTVTSKPVLGIAESAMRLALTKGDRFGVISILDVSIPRHLRYVDKLGLTEQLAGDRAVGLGVLELEQAPDAIERMVQTGKDLRDRDGADVLILGCAGMALQREQVEAALGIPVIEPCQGGVTMASRALAS